MVAMRENPYFGTMPREVYSSGMEIFNELFYDINIFSTALIIKFL